VTNFDDFFNHAEAQFRPLEPGTIVEYKGSMLAAHGLWVVRVQLDEERYTLAHSLNEWERLNADRIDIEPILEEGSTP
jgi:hypothetical protein